MKIFLHDGDRRLQAQSGYGQLAAGLASELPRCGHNLQFAPGAPDRDTDICLHTCPPSSIRPERLDLPQAAFTMHERDTLSEDKAHWVEVLNRVDVVLTPTEWNLGVWRALGVRTPIAVVPLGIDPASYHPHRSKSFTIFTAHENLGSDSSRENWRDTLLAYVSAFLGRNDVELIVKTWKWKARGWEKACSSVAAELGIDLADTPPTTVLDQELSTDQMRQFYQRSSIFLKNANREGWGLPATEAVACGTLVAASRIEPLLSHLPDDTAWFDLGDTASLTRILQEQEAAHRSAMDKVDRFVWARTAQLTSAALTRCLDGKAR